MGSNSLGKIFQVSSYGESHGKEVGALIDGCPAGVRLDLDFIQSELDRRKPGQSNLSSQRKEEDTFEILSGVFRGVTTGAPILIRIPNRDHISSDYDHLEDLFRPSHADQTYQLKYGIRDHRGGGRSSARITAGWVAAGALAKLVLLERSNARFVAAVRQIHDIIDETPIENLEWDKCATNPVRCANLEKSEEMQRCIESARIAGDSLGGVIRGAILHPETGIGEPVFSKLSATLGHAFLSLNAVKGVSFGEGFNFSYLKGSNANDSWNSTDKPSPSTNRSGGISGGISNGNTIYFDLAFKPTASIQKKQNFLHKTGEIIESQITGRHDPCVLPRAVPIVEALSAICYIDLHLYHKSLSIK